MKRFLIFLILVSYSIIYSQTSVEEAWTLNFPPFLDFNNINIVDMGKDNTGNIYLTGTIYENTGNADIFLMKIVSTSFLVEWIAVYNGPANTNQDVADDLEIDNEGNCYVAGLTYTGNNNSDYLTIKFNPSGQQVWVNSYNGLADYMDWINDLFVDNAGNVYVTGANHEQSQFYTNATTIKYNSDGVMQWKSTYVDSNLYDDEGKALTVDNSGNVYVAGQTYTTSTQFLTIKYDSAGVEQWTRIAGSPAQIKYAQFIGLDNSGWIFVGGTNYNPSPPYGPIGYTIWKFNPNGSGAGTTYNSPLEMRGMVVSPLGNVYVTGSQELNGGYSTVKFNSSLNFQWESLYNGGLHDRPNDIKIDADENIYITGHSDPSPFEYNAVTIKYNSAGAQLWVNSHDNQTYTSTLGRVILLDNSGDLYVAVGNSSGVGNYPEIIKLNNSNGNQQWVSNFKSFSQPTSIQEDSEGNIYIAGFGGLNQSMWDYITMKCDSSGKIKWIRTYNGPANEADQANDIEIDSEGNVYVTGGSKGIGTDFDFATIKYDSSGNEQWVVRYNSPAFYSDIAGDISVDADGNVYVSGSSLGSNTSYDIATIKYNNLGQLQWVKRYNGSADGNDLAQGLEIDLSGNVFVVGTSDSTGSLYDYVTIKYNPSGNVEWVKRYNGLANDGDLVSSMSLDNSGNVFVTGWSFGNTTNSDYATVKYNSSGVEQWSARWDDPASSYDYANDIAVDGDGNVYVTGISQGMGTDNDYTTVKYNSIGEQQWAVPYNGQSNGSDVAYHVTLDHLGDIYVAGYSNNNAEYSTIKYNKQGVQQWEINFDLLNYQDTATDLLVDNSGNVVVAGYSSKAGEEWLWSIVKYKQPGFLPSDVETETTLPTEFVLYQNYPNPFNPTTKISWQSPVSTWQSLKVYDVLGNEVATLVDEERPAGSYEEIFDANYLSSGVSARGGYASGVYFFRIKAGEFVQTKKLILMK